MFETLDMGASGLMAQRTRLDTIAANIANANTTHDVNGNPSPYRRRFVLFAPGQQNNPSQPGVHVQSIKQDQSPFQKRFDPGHPDADKDGYVQYPNIDMTVEYVNALEASRAYEANISMMETSKAMINATLRFDRLEKSALSLTTAHHMINGIDTNLAAPKLSGIGSAGQAGATGGASFADTLKNSIEEVAKLQQDASRAVEDLASGKTEDVAGVMTAMEKSDLAFKTLLAIRSKLMDAYEEIKNVSI